MKAHFNINIWSLIFCLSNILPSCGQSQNNNPNKSDKSIFDTSEIAIIPFNTNKFNFFDGSYKQTTLTKEEMPIIEKLLFDSVNYYNNSLDTDQKEMRINLRKVNYKIQLMPALNKNGEKEVWVCCLCDTKGRDLWKTEILNTDGEGTCYFNFMINLNTKKYSYFQI